MNKFEQYINKLDKPNDRVIFYGYLSYFLISFALLLPFVNTNYCNSEELTLLVDTKRILMGQHQHRDFFNTWGAASLYLPALIWKIFGTISYQSIRILTFIIIILTGLLLTLITRHFTKRFWLSLLPATVFINYFAHCFPFSNYQWFGSFASIIFCFFLVRYLFTLKPKMLYICGICTGISLCFMISAGVINLITSILMLTIYALLLRRKRSKDDPLRLGSIYFAGLITIIFPIFAGYLAIGALDKYLDNSFIWPFNNYTRINSINNIPWANDLTQWRGSGEFLLGPFRPIYFFGICAVMINLLIPIFTLLGWGALLTSPSTVARFFLFNPSLLPLTDSSISSNEKKFYPYWIILVLTLWAAGFYISAIIFQPYYPQLLWSSLPILILLVAFIDRMWNIYREMLGARRLIGAILAFFLISLVCVTIDKTARVYRGDKQDLINLKTGRMTDHPIIELINREVTGDDYIFAHEDLSQLYFQVNAKPVTGYTAFFENFLTPTQINEIFSDLYEKKPKFMAFTSERSMIWLTKDHNDFQPWLKANYLLIDTNNTEGLLLYKRKD